MAAVRAAVVAALYKLLSADAPVVDRYPGIEIIVLGDLHQITQYWGITILGDYNTGGSDTWGFWAARWRAFWGI